MMKTGQSDGSHLKLGESNLQDMQKIRETSDALFFTFEAIQEMPKTLSIYLFYCNTCWHKNTPCLTHSKIAMPYAANIYIYIGYEKVKKKKGWWWAWAGS